MACDSWSARPDRPHKGLPSYDAAMSAFHEFQMADIEGQTVGFEKFRDQVSLVVNVASK